MKITAILPAIFLLAPITALADSGNCSAPANNKCVVIYNHTSESITAFGYSSKGTRMSTPVTIPAHSSNTGTYISTSAGNIFLGSVSDPSPYCHSLKNKYGYISLSANFSLNILSENSCSTS